MAEILIKAVDATNADPAKDRRGCYKRGYPVVVFPDGHEWGAEERSPKFIVLKLPGVSADAVKNQIENWCRRIKFTVTLSTLSTDTHTIKAEATEFNSTSGEGKLSRAVIEAFLTAWGATGIAVADNAVTFSIKIADAIKSKGFWMGGRVDDLFFTERNYAQAGGIHRTEINYSLRAFENDEDRDNWVKMAQERGTFVSHNATNKTLVMDFTREFVRGWFLEDVKQRTEQPIVRRRRRVAEAIVASAVEAGGELTLDETTYNAAVIDQMTER